MAEAVLDMRVPAGSATSLSQPPSQALLEDEECAALRRLLALPPDAQHLLQHLFHATCSPLLLAFPVPAAADGVRLPPAVQALCRLGVARVHSDGASSRGGSPAARVQREGGLCSAGDDELAALLLQLRQHEQRALFTKLLGKDLGCGPRAHAPAAGGTAGGAAGRAAEAAAAATAELDSAVEVEALLSAMRDGAGGMARSSRRLLLASALAQRPTSVFGAGADVQGGAPSDTRSFVLQLHDRTAALLLRVQQTFCTSAGFSPEAAVGLLATDMRRLCFPAGLRAGAGTGARGGTGAGAGPESEVAQEVGAGAGQSASVVAAAGPLPLPLYRSRVELQEMEVALRAGDLLDAAAAAGDADVAMQVLHEVSCHFMPASEDAPAPAAEMARSPAATWAALQQAACCCRGVALLERQGRYSEACHYLRLLLGAVFDADAWVAAGRAAGAPPPANRTPSAAAAAVAQHGAAHAQHWVRLVRNLRHLRCASAALRACEAALADSDGGVASGCGDDGSDIGMPLRVKGGRRVALEQVLRQLAVPPRRWRPPPLPQRLPPSLERTFRAGIATGTGAGGGEGDGWSGGGFGNKHRSGVGSAWRARGAGVEAFALARYIRLLNARDGGGWRGMHCENALWLTLHGLLRLRARPMRPPGGDSEASECGGGRGGATWGWHSPYADVPGAQLLPPLARPCRRCRPRYAPFRSLDEVLNALRLGFRAAVSGQRALDEVVLRGLNVNVARAVACEGFAGGDGEGEGEGSVLCGLEDVVRCAGHGVVQAIVDALDTDYSLFSHGLPDVFLFRATAGNGSSCSGGGGGDGCGGDGAVNRCRCSGTQVSDGCGAGEDEFAACRPSKLAVFAEVKGPGDSLSAQQTDWIDRLRRAGAHVELCKVR
eukprot:g995.t1